MERYLNAVRQRALRRSSKEKERGWGDGRERKVEVRGAKHEVAYLVRFYWGECFFPLSIRELGRMSFLKKRGVKEGNGYVRENSIISKLWKFFGRKRGTRETLNACALLKGESER